MQRPIVWEHDYELEGEIRLALGSRTLIMGILNTTPDSFSDGGQYNELHAAVAHARRMALEGADIIDIGGESTRPGSEPVPLQEELNRVIPIIKAVREALPSMPISIDTYKAETARQALLAGANIINDVWGLQADPDMAAVAAATGAPVVIGHNRKQHKGYTELVHDVGEELRSSVNLALQAGVKREMIWIDPGIGFAKGYEDNLELLGRLEELSSLGFPMLLGTSRKRFIRHTLDLPPEEVVMGTAATTALGIAHGCQIVRVHDVKAMKQTALMTDAIIYRQAARRRLL